MTTGQSDIYGEREPLAGDLARGAYISIARVILGSIFWIGVVFEFVWS